MSRASAAILPHPKSRPRFFFFFSVAPLGGIPAVDAYSADPGLPVSDERPLLIWAVATAENFLIPVPSPLG